MTGAVDDVSPARQSKADFKRPFLVGDADDAGDKTDSTPPGDSTTEGVEITGAIYSVDAKHDTHKMLLEERDLVRHPSDGGGTATLASARPIDGDDRPLRAGDFARLEFVYEAGPLGIENGGELHFQVSSFWQWDPPQNQMPDQRGYTEVRTDAEGVKLLPEWHGTELLAIGISGRRLEAGEKVTVIYGAGNVGAKIDAFAERGAELWFAVDGDGDGIRKFIAKAPSVDIAPAGAERLIVMLPTTLTPGESFEAFVSVLDRYGSTGVPFAGEVQFDVPKGIEFPESVVFDGSEEGRKRVPGVASEAGIYRISATATATDETNQPRLATRANPIVVEEGIQHVRWADLHGHSQFTDGTGTPDDYFTYAREVSGLDVACLTDHDHWGIQFMDENPWMWQTIRETVKAHHEPGLFVSLLGYEWTSWLHGHRHVLYFGDEGEIYSSIDPDYETPVQLWKALEGQQALTFAHHSAGGPVSTNWYYPPHSVFEPVTEVSSVHGSSEAEDSPGAIYNPVKGNFVRDLLNAGFRVGFIGSGDSHDGHPGLAHLSNDGGSGLAALYTEDVTREGVLKALRDRRTYATNGARIYLEVSVDGKPMGTILEPADAAAPSTYPLFVRVVGEGPLSHVDIIRSGRHSRIELEGELEWSLFREIPRLARGEYHYIRVVERSGAVAWSSPIFAN